MQRYQEKDNNQQLNNEILVKRIVHVLMAIIKGNLF